MTGIHRESNTPTQCPSSSQLDTFDRPKDDTRSSNSLSHQHHQHYDTPRAKRFSQKLVDAAKKQPLARTPSTSASLSPPLESCMMDDNDYYDNDESMADTDSSCFASPNHDDQIMNNHFQNLLLSSPLRPDLTMMRPLQLDSSHLSSAIPHDPSEPNEVLNRRRLQDKRPVKQHSISDSPSLSAKPKRRKLKQQRTTSWRTGPDVTLDTDKVHLALEPDQRRPSSSPIPTSPSHQPQQGSARRSSRLANRKVSYGETMGIAYKKPLVVLGIPGGGVKTESEPAIVIDDRDYSGRNGTSSSSSNTEQQQQQEQHRQPKPPRKIRRRVDTVENRLNQLIFARDTLDLSQHTVLPTSSGKAPPSSTQKTPLVVVIDDSDNETDTPTHTNPIIEQQQQQEIMKGGQETNNDQGIGKADLGHDNDNLLNKVKREPIDKAMDLSTTTPQSQHDTLLLKEITIDQSAATETHEDMDMDMNMTEGEPPLTNEFPPPLDGTNTQHADDDLVMADNRRSPSPKGDFTNEDTILLSNGNGEQQNMDTDSYTTKSNTIRAPSSCSSTPSSPTPTPTELNDPLPPPSNCLSSSVNDSSSIHQDTTTSPNNNDDNHLHPSASKLASLSTTSSSALESLESTAATAATAVAISSIPTSTENATSLADTSRQSSQQTNGMYTILTSDKTNTTTTKESAGTTSLTEDKNSAWTSSSQQHLPADLGEGTIGSSEGSTFFGRLIGSASHFFLGN